MANYTKILVFSDIHYQDPGETIIGLDPRERFETALAHALAHHPDATRIVLLGDLTHHGRPVQYQSLRESLQATDLPITFLMGNHDRRDAFLQVFPGADVTPSGHVQSTHDLGGTHLITLDTLDGPPYPEALHSGRLCQARLDWLETALAAAGDAQVLLAMHHPAFLTGFTGMDEIRLLDDARFWDILQASPSPIHMLCGHVHRTISGHARGVPFSILKSTCHQMPMMLGVEGSSHSTDEPGAYGIIAMMDDQIIVHTEDFALAALATPTSDPSSE